MRGGDQSKKRLLDDSRLLLPGLVGRQFGSLTIVSRKTEGGSWKLRVEVECSRCGQRHMTLYHNLRKRDSTKACPNCNPRRPVKAPLWIYYRCQHMKSRCSNPNEPQYPNYGGRGIQFKFESANEAAAWIAEHLGVPTDRTLQIDRKDNNGHYEPGNLRWSTNVEQCNNTRRNKGGRSRFIRFRKQYPGIRYADSTLPPPFFVMGANP